MNAARRRRGFAVAVALYMLAAIAGLAAASFYAVLEARRAVNRSARQEEAASAAELGLQAILAMWDVAKRDSMAIGWIDSATPIRTRVSGTRIRSHVIRLTPSTYWIASAGTAASGTSVDATRTYSLLVEILRPRVLARAALVTRGNVVAGGELLIDGRDVAPPGWTDCPPADTAAAPSIIVADGAAATSEDGRPMPNVQVDSTASAISSYQSLGRVAASALANRATITVAPGAIVSPDPDTGGDCRSAGASAGAESWGEPTRTGGAGGCERFYPVVHAPGDLTVRRGRGQGILLVSGRLRIEGPFLFHGLVVTQGGMYATGPDVRIYGAVAAIGAGGVVWRAEGELRRSSCAIARASDAAARAYPVPLRAWSELF